MFFRFCIFKVRRIRLGFSFKKLKIPLLYFNSQPTDSQSGVNNFLDIIAYCMCVFVVAYLTAYLICLGMLWAGYFPGWLSYLTNGAVNAYAWTKCGLVFFCWYFFRHYSSALLTMMTVEKFIALYFPLKTKSICTVKTAKWASGIAGVFYALINIFWFFVVNVETLNEARVTFCRFKDFYVPYSWYVTKIDATLYAYLPFATMGLCNVAIIYKFVKAQLAAKRGGTESTNQALSSAAMRGTAILITVTMTFLILTVPTNIILSISLQTHPLLSPFLYFLVCLNHSINGFLYCIVGTRFRKELIATLCCNRIKLYDTEGGTSKATSVTSVKSG